MSEITNAILRSAQLPFIGRVGGNPEVKYFPSGAVNCKFSIAINRGKKDDNLPPDWFKVEMWGDMAVTAGDVIKKGDLVKVTGRVSVERWKGRDEVEHEDKVIRAEEWLPVASTKPAQQQTTAPANDFGSDDDDVPF